MKRLLLASVFLAFGSSLRADNLLQNSDFAAGSANWQGDGQIFAGSNLSANSFGGKGLTVLLNPHSWTKIYQEFKGDKGTAYSINVTYRVSTDLVLSAKPEDYVDVNKHLGLTGYENFGDFNLPVGQFLGTIGDSSSTTVAYEVYVPKLGSTDVQTYQHTYPPIPANGNNVAALAFPPGTGSVVILSVSVTSN